MRYPLMEHGGSGPVLHWAPANGFPLTTYRPILDGLARWFRCVTLPPRALWADASLPPEQQGDWAELAADLAAGMGEHALEDVIAVGHSFGGVASLTLAAQERGRVRALILLDPVILPAETMARYHDAKRANWLPGGHPLARKALTRREVFTSPEEAFDFWRARRLFADWSDAALERYVDGALRSDGPGRYVLHWSGAWEAYYYRSFRTDTWHDVARLDQSLPILVVAGAASDTFVPTARSEFEAAVPWSASVVIEDAGHLFPQARPEATLAVLGDWLSRIVRS